MKINSLKFHGSKVEKDLVEFIDEAYGIVAFIEASSVEKAELRPINLNMWLKFGMINRSRKEVKERAKLNGTNSKVHSWIGTFHLS